jgi:hypothetical protein
MEVRPLTRCIATTLNMWMCPCGCRLRVLLVASCGLVKLLLAWCVRALRTSVAFAVAAAGGQTPILCVVATRHLLPESGLTLELTLGRTMSYCSIARLGSLRC